jgi:hypothetical protein
VSPLPELGPRLGRLASPSSAPTGIATILEPVRVQLLSEIFERNGTARKEARDLESSAWLEGWERATHAATELVLAEVERRVQEAAAVSRFPRSRIALALPSAEDRAVLAAQFSAAGSGLEAAVAAGGNAAGHPAGELEGAWERLSETAGRELAIWNQRAAEIRAWRRPWRPLLLGGAAAGLVALWIGLVLGGYLPVPALLRPLAEWYWRLPWP